MKIRIHNPIYGVPITFLDKWRPFEPVYILNPDRYANEYIISSVIKPFSYFYCLIPTQFRIVGLLCDNRCGYPMLNGIPTYTDEKHKNSVCGVLNGKRVYPRLLIQKV